MNLSDIISTLPQKLAILQKTREILLANTVMIGEIPAPTFEERERIRFLRDRFNECNCNDVGIDEIGNSIALIPGTTGTSHILVIAHADTHFSQNVDHTVSVTTNRLTGAGICDNSLGLAGLASLPTILPNLGLTFKDNILLMGAVQSLGFGNLQGLQFFLEHNKLPIRAAICIEGVNLGRLSYSSIGMLRASIECRVPSKYDWSRFRASGAINTLNRVISHILAIPLPREPRTSIILGSISGGAGFNMAPSLSQLRFEVRSDSEKIVEKVHKDIENIIDEVASETNTEIKMTVVAQRKPGGLSYSHPLVHTCREVIRGLHRKPLVSPSTGELAILIARGIPAITIGLSLGDNLYEINESVEIEPIFDGFTQLVAMLQAIDEGLCNEH